MMAIYFISIQKIAMIIKVLYSRGPKVAALFPEIEKHRADSIDSAVIRICATLYCIFNCEYSTWPVFKAHVKMI